MPKCDFNKVAKGTQDKHIKQPTNCLSVFGDFVVLVI